MYLRAFAHVTNHIIDRSLIFQVCCDVEKVDYDWLFSKYGTPRIYS